MDQYLLMSLLLVSKLADGPLESSARSTAIFKSSIHFSISDTELEWNRDRANVDAAIDTESQTSRIANSPRCNRANKVISNGTGRT